ncbi:MAG: hypothetical protein SPF46_03945 [Blautia sp.]|nr:hypothetical protein [Blautia sp.]
MEYLDERIIGYPTCSKDALRKQIDELEIKNFGHTTSKTVSQSNFGLKKNGKKKIYSGKEKGFIYR